MDNNNAKIGTYVFIRDDDVYKLDKKFLDFHNRFMKEDISKIKSYLKKGQLKDKEILIKETVPLAPFMFLGALITIIIRGELVSWVVNILRWKSTPSLEMMMYMH